MLHCLVLNFTFWALFAYYGELWAWLHVNTRYVTNLVIQHLSTCSHYEIKKCTKVFPIISVFFLAGVFNCTDCV